MALPQEEILLDSPNADFSFSMQGARLENKKRITFIPAGNITSVEIKHMDEPVLIALAAISFIGFMSWAGVQENAGIVIFGLIVSAIFGAMYYYSKQRVLKISSATSSISINIKSHTHKQSVHLVNQIESRIP